VFGCNMFFDEGNTARKKKGSPSLTVPMSRLLIGEQIRRHATRTCPDWMAWYVEQRSRRRELAYFYHYSARKILPPRRQYMRK
jgi:hypothetical protein